MEDLEPEEMVAEIARVIAELRDAGRPIYEDDLNPIAGIAQVRLAHRKLMEVDRHLDPEQRYEHRKVVWEASIAAAARSAVEREAERVRDGLVLLNTPDIDTVMEVWCQQRFEQMSMMLTNLDQRLN